MWYGSDGHLLLHFVRDAAALLLLVDELPPHAQHGLERTQPPVVMLLPREQLPRELEDLCRVGAGAGVGVRLQVLAGGVRAG